MNHASIHLWDDVDVVFPERAVRRIVEGIMPRKSLDLLTRGGRFVKFDGQLRVLREARTVRILDQVVHGVLRLWNHARAVTGAGHVYAHGSSPPPGTVALQVSHRQPSLGSRY